VPSDQLSIKGFEERFSSAEGPFQHVAVVLDEVERGLATAQMAEVAAERTGAVLLWIIAVVLGGAVILGLAALFSFRWLSRNIERKQAEVVQQREGQDSDLGVPTTPSGPSGPSGPIMGPLDTH